MKNRAIDRHDSTAREKTAETALFKRLFGILLDSGPAISNISM
jgi:hypothetical protein